MFFEKQYKKADWKKEIDAIKKHEVSAVWSEKSDC